MGFDSFLGNAKAVQAVRDMLVRIANENPAFVRFRELCDDTNLAEGTRYREVIAALEEHFAEPGRTVGGASLFDLLRAPALASPTSLSGQLGAADGTDIPAMPTVTGI